MITTFSVSDTFMQKIKDEAEKTGMGVSEYIRYCIMRYWDAKEEAEKILKRGE